MLAMLLRRLLVALLLAITGMALLERFNPHPPELVIAAHRVGMAAMPVDWPVCVTIRTGPLRKAPRPGAEPKPQEEIS
jgi:hypothetical protein